MKSNPLLRVSLLVLLALLGLAAAPRNSAAQSVTRLTYYQGTDAIAAWDPRGVRIAYCRSKAIGGSVFDAYKVESSGQSGEQPLLTGLNTDFGTAVGLSWIGTTGFLAVEEAISGFEILKFDTSLAPFDRTVTNGADTANAVLLSIDGGGGGGLTKISRDGLHGLIRFSSSGSIGNISIRGGLVTDMQAQAASAFGTALISLAGAASGFYYNGGALTPDGSQAIVSVPLTTPTAGHDLAIGDASAVSTFQNLTNTASQGVTNAFPDVSPDGTKVVFSRKASLNKDATYDLYLMNIDGTGIVQLTNTPNFDEYRPSWSPDGGSIVFDGIHVGGHESESPALEAGESANYNIYLLSLSASEAGVVTPRTKLKEPPLVTIASRVVTLTLTPFSRAASTAARRVFAVASSPKMSFRYEAVVTRTSGKRGEYARRVSKRNAISLRNVPAGTYSAKYRVQITSRSASGTTQKFTKFSPAASFTVEESS